MARLPSTRRVSLMVLRTALDRVTYNQTNYLIIDKRAFYLSRRSRNQTG